MKATCPTCKAAFKIDDAKIPDKGTIVKCPKCQNRFFIQKKSSAPPKKVPAQKVSEQVICPKCGFSQPKSETCVQCGIIFAKYQQPSQKRETAGSSQPVKPEFSHSTPKTNISRSSKSFPLLPVVLIAIIAIAGVFIYLNYIGPRLSAGNFTNSLADFGSQKMDLPDDDNVVQEGDMPFRTGKILIVQPEHYLFINPRQPTRVPPEIHPVWYKLSGSLRASDPGEVDTLIRISRELKKSQRYQKIDGVAQKVVSIHTVHIDVYNWRTQTFIGRWTIDPGDLISEVMLEEELELVIDKTSNKTLLRIIESMPEK